MRTGASGVCSMGGLTSECNSAELRFWYGDEQLFKDNLKYCIDNNIYAICNFDFHKWDSHYPFDIGRLDTMLTIMNEVATNETARITVENEPMKYWSREDYCDMVNQVYTRVNGDYFVGANNEEFGLGAARNLYPYLFENAEFDYFDIHIQSTMIDPATWRVNFETVRHWLSQSRAWCNQYGKKLSCTEANWSRIKEETGHKDLMQERELAKQYGCEDFNIVFIDGELSQYEWLAYLKNGQQNSTYWPDLRQRMLDEKETKGVLDGMIIKTIGHKDGDIKFGNRVVQLHQLLVIANFLEENEIADFKQYDSVTEQALRDFQTALKVSKPWITVDGRTGRQTWDELILAVPDLVERDNQWRKFNMYNSPINKKGDV